MQKGKTLLSTDDELSTDRRETTQHFHSVNAHLNKHLIIASQAQVASNCAIVDKSTSGIFGDSDVQLHSSVVASASASANACAAAASSSRPQTFAAALSLQQPAHPRIFLKPLRPRHRHHIHNPHHQSFRAACFPQSAALCSRVRRLSQSRTPPELHAKENAPRDPRQQMLREKQRGTGGDARLQEERRDGSAPACGSGGGGGGGGAGGGNGGGAGGGGRHRHQSGQTQAEQQALQLQASATDGSPQRLSLSRSRSHSQQALVAPLASFEDPVGNALGCVFADADADADPVLVANCEPVPPGAACISAVAAAVAASPTPYTRISLYENAERENAEQRANAGPEQVAAPLFEGESLLESDNPSTDCQVLHCIDSCHHHRFLFFCLATKRRDREEEKTFDFYLGLFSYVNISEYE